MHVVTLAAVPSRGLTFAARVAYATTRSAPGSTEKVASSASPM
jgi:hypothetical protein